MILTNINKSYGDNVVFKDFNLQIADNKITCILGKSGCGKTTLLNIIANLTDYSGQIDTNNEKISFIFQNQSLLNNLTVAKNLEYVLKSCNFTKEEIAQKIAKILKVVKLEDVDNYPKTLSGGMKQRVSLARAFVYPGKILLMDEPFKGLDISLKKHIITTFKELYYSDPKTTVFVTHDIEEALLIAARIIVLGDKGTILLDKEIPQSVFERDTSILNNLREEIYNII